MKKTGIMFGMLLALAIPAGDALASGKIALPSHGDAVSLPTLAGNSVAIRPAGYSFCPAIAETAQVRGKGIDYIRTPEFAEAVTAVANGTSGFAPGRVPAEWKGAARLWRETVTANGKPKIAVVPGETIGDNRAILLSPGGTPIDPKRFGLEERSCNPDLLFRASLEYRARQGQEDAPLLYPHLVRKAASGVEKRILAKMDTAVRSAKRADDIAERILRAEKAGAAECLPQELARAKAELAVLRAGIADIDFDPGVTEAVLAKAEPLSGTLLAAHSYAALHGIRCFPE